METVLGVSMTPTAVRAVLVEGEHAQGATVDTDAFEVVSARGPVNPTGPDQVVSAILGTREGAAESGCPLASVGVTWTDPIQAAALRDLLADQRIEKVMLVSAFLAAASLTQTVGNSTRYAHTALLFVEPSTATMAVVHTADGSVADVRRQELPDDEDEAVAALTAMAAGAEAMEPRPDGLFVVGSDGVDIAAISPQLQAASSLVVSTPEEPGLALARGAALASAHPPLFSSSTAAIAYAQDPGTGEVAPHAVGLGYADFPATVERGAEALAYSADPEEAGLTPARGLGTGAYPPVDDDADSPWTGSGAAATERRATRPFLVAMSVLGLFVGGVLALVIALAIAIRPHVDTRPQIGANAVAPAPPPAASTPPPAAPEPARVAPAPAAPAPAAPAPA
ncbi:DUF7159 family protein, partial [Mycobacterium mantenii]|uniref:DUF7159 family protein n=3 Tax=Mycobacterium mantenii TaxID=560555 RepID=UPI0007FD9B24